MAIAATYDQQSDIPEAIREHFIEVDVEGQKKWRVEFTDPAVRPENTTNLISALEKERRGNKEASEKVTTLEGQLSERDATIKSLQDKDPDGLLKRHEAAVAELNQKHDAEAGRLRSRYLGLAKESAISRALHEAGARDVPRLTRILGPDVNTVEDEQGNVSHQVLGPGGIVRQKPKSEGSLELINVPLEDLVAESKSDDGLAVLFNGPHNGAPSSPPKGNQSADLSPTEQAQAINDELLKGGVNA